MINDLTHVWRDFHEHLKLEAIDSTWWLSLDGEQGRLPEKYSKDNDIWVERRQGLRLHSIIILRCESVAFSLLLRVIYFLGIDNMAQHEKN